MLVVNNAAQRLGVMSAQMPPITLYIAFAHPPSCCKHYVMVVCSEERWLAKKQPGERCRGGKCVSCSQRNNTKERAHLVNSWKMVWLSQMRQNTDKPSMQAMPTTSPYKD